MIAKMIKFELLIDGVKVAAPDGLQDHFTTEILGHYRSSLLARWLRSRGCSFTGRESNPLGRFERLQIKSSSFPGLRLAQGQYCTPINTSIAVHRSISASNRSFSSSSLPSARISA